MDTPLSNPAPSIMFYLNQEGVRHDEVRELIILIPDVSKFTIQSILRKNWRTQSGFSLGAQNADENLRLKPFGKRSSLF